MRTTTFTALHAFTILAVAGLALPASAQPASPENQASALIDTNADAQRQSRVDVVFVLDTTGSMSGLIEGAKQTIWSIASTIATAEPTPTVRMGLVGYRDRSDDYITTRTPLTDDLDAVYADLMKYAAAGGGDTPESVNQALHEALTEFDWSDDEDGVPTLRLIYLVGDAPPKIYEDDTPHADTCAAAAERGIIINTVQCGSADDTRQIWNTIARAAEGAYFAIPQSGGVEVIETPFDAELAELGTAMRGTMLDYGDQGVQQAQAAKREVASKLDDAAPAPAAADRTSYAYASGAAGRKTALGVQELVDDVASGRVKLDGVPEQELPEPMQAMTPEERAAHVEKLAAERAELQTKIEDLAAKRSAYIAAERARRAALSESPESAFDAAVTQSLREQANRYGITISAPNADDGRDAPSPEAAPEIESSEDTP